MNHSSRLLQDAVEAFSSLPGIGRKTALRLALHLLKQEPEQVDHLSDAIKQFRREIRLCSACFNLSDQDLCAICTDHHRNKQTICVVESVRDVMAIEETQQYRGLYHVLGGVINPLDGVGPEQLQIESLLVRIRKHAPEEIIMAISPTIEGETTIYYISRLMRELPVRISTIARGVAFGGELEYADEITLGRSIMSRIPYATNSE
ncbi:MAG: recombination mediator RecR [Saprospiraceae bacterium]|nr:recombination mediator RecR [Saprospiraceae bacterium]